MKSILIILTLTICSCFSFGQEPLLIADFEILNNTKWEGKLTYKDYQSGDFVSIPATMQIQLKDAKLVTNIQYTYEPHKNNKSSVRIKKNGTYFGNEKIISNQYENGTRTFVTTYTGKDGGQKATMFITHQFNKNTYKVIKEVLVEQTKQRFVRNTYEFNKKL